MLEINNLTHPEYDLRVEDWIKWRLTYNSGRYFINTYLQKFSNREDDDDFKARREITYCPAFAKSAINDVKNSVFQRFVDITRVGGTASYQDAVNGGQFGVDLLGSDLSSYIGRIILPELLVMGKVGIYVDMPIINQDSLIIDNQLTNNKQLINKRPYIYIYNREDIRSWYYDDSANPHEYSSLLLREYKYIFDPETKLPIDTITLYKHFYLENGRVYVNHYNENNELVDTNGQTGVLGPLQLNITRIPFVVAEISDSLMTDIADYQIALLNLASSDILYSLKSNFPFYVEQQDLRNRSPYLKNNTNDSNNPNNNDQDRELNVGPTSGRVYPVGANQPAFIHPSPEPLLASIKKQEQLKEEIRLILNLTITNLQPTRGSSESKGFDDRTLESGLSYIGLELQHVEQQIGQIWSMYENSKDYPQIKYPEKYNLKSDEDRRQDCKQLSDLLPILPSKIYQKEIAKSIADTLLRSRVSDKILNEIKNEIDKADVIHVDPKALSSDVEHGLVSLKTASLARGYPKGEVEQAKQDHVDRLARIAIAQSKGAAAELTNNNQLNGAARGLSDTSPNNSPNQDAQNEKNNSQGVNATLINDTPVSTDSFKRK